MSKLKKKFCFSKNFESYSISVRQSFVKITRMVFESLVKTKFYLQLGYPACLKLSHFKHIIMKFLFCESFSVNHSLKYFRVFNYSYIRWSTRRTPMARGHIVSSLSVV